MPNDLPVRMANVSVANVDLKRWDRQFLHALDGLSKRQGEPVAQLVVRELIKCPRGVALLHFDQFAGGYGRVVVVCNPVDRELVESSVARSGGRLKAIEMVPGGEPCKELAISG